MSSDEFFCPEPLDPLKPFYIIYHGDENDALDLAWESYEGIGTQDEAVEQAKESVKESGGTRIIYRCIPMVKVRLGPMRVQKLTK